SMGDEDLRELERAAASSEMVRLKLAEATLRQKGASAALRVLEPLLQGESEAAGLARRRALAIAVATKEIDDAASPAAVFARLFGEGLGSIDEVAAMSRETPASEMAVRVILVRALRGRSKRASQALARELPESDPLRGILAAEGEILI